MSYAFAAFLVDADQIRHALGRTPRLRAWRWVRTDPLLARLVADGERGPVMRTLTDPGYLTSQEAKDRAHVPSYVAEALCGLLGTALDSDELTGIGYSFIEHCSEAMREAGTDVGIDWAMDDYEPLGLPTPDDFPVVHTTSPEDAQNVLQELDKLQVAALPDDVVAPVRQFRSWYEAAVAQQRTLVTFYH